MVHGTSCSFAQVTQSPDCGRVEDEYQPYCPKWEPLPTYHPYPYDCKKFLECSNGVAVGQCCSPGTVWDQSMLVCNHEGSTPCVIFTTPPPTTTTPTTTTPTTTTSTTTTPTTSTPTTTTPTTTTPTTTTTTKPTTTTPTTTTPTTTTPTTTPKTTTPASTTTEDPITWICPEGYQGPIAHPYDCHYFYICDPGRRACLIECSASLYYNPNTEQCDWPNNVPHCVGGTPPPGTPTPKPQTTTPLPNYRNQPKTDESNVSHDPCEMDETLLKYIRNANANYFS
ncbi:integumentary mucin C.1-like [Folsomia candida]|uniref:integumentary mucin C.1-like n=1 Tax=Folsomia candida TaxID=158441 RepID=UPI001604FFF4|nr:integumentary mucin C.1-like [Folsomia candida]